MSLGGKRFPAPWEAGAEARVLDVRMSVQRCWRRSEVAALARNFIAGTAGSLKYFIRDTHIIVLPSRSAHGEEDGQTDDTVDRSAGARRRRSRGQGPARGRTR